MRRMLLALVLAWGNICSANAAGTVEGSTRWDWTWNGGSGFVVGPDNLDTCNAIGRQVVLVPGFGWGFACYYDRPSSGIGAYNTQAVTVWGTVRATPSCPAHATLTGSTCTCSPGHQPDASRTSCVPQPVEATGCTAGNPVQPGTGRKLHEETDYAGAGAAPLELRRLYRSTWSDGSAAAGLAPVATWSGGWRFNLHARLSLLPSGEVRAVRPDGSVTVFLPQPASAPAGAPASAPGWAAQAGSADTLSEVLDAAGQRSGFTLKVFADDSTEQYDASGRLLGVSARHGWSTTLEYDTAGRLAGVRNAFGRQLVFGYDAAGRIATMSAPGGEITRYEYDAAGNLASVTWPDGHLRRYHYEDARHPHALTGITDELGVRIGSYAYDAQARVVETAKAGGAERLTLAYPAPGQTTVTDHSGATPVTRSYGFVNHSGVLRPASLSAPCSLCGATAQASEYDAQGRTLREIAHDGSVTFFAYDARGREVERATFPASYHSATTRPPLSAATSVSSTRWHATFNLPTQRAEPGRISAWSYSAKGLPTGSSWTATTDGTGAAKFSAGKTGSTYATGYSYNAAGLVSTVVERETPPGGTALETQRWTMAYNAAADLTRVTDVTGGNKIQRYSQHDPHGRVLAGTAFDGQPVAYTYSTRGYITSRTGGGVATGYGYSAAGRLSSVSTPDGVMTYTRDSLGNITGVNNDYVYRAAYPTAPSSGTSPFSRLIHQLIPSAHAQAASCQGYGLVAHLGVLHLYDATGKLVAAYPFTSGLGGSTDYTAVNFGPIPPGRYTFDPATVYESAWRHRVLGGVPPFWPAFARDQGAYYVNLVADPSNPVQHRSGFMIHGGRVPGSAGCIDLGDKDRALLPRLKKAACNPVTLIVTSRPVK